MQICTKNKIKSTLYGIAGVAVLSTSTITNADHRDGWSWSKPPAYSYSGPCAHLPADRATEFHGNPMTSDLNLGMAGNQWVVFDNVLQGFNVATGRSNSANDPQHHEYADITLESLNEAANRYYVQLIPPGQIRDQIKAGCMTLGDDEDRNFLPGNIQVNFDVYTSTNYNLMRNLANAGFLTEAAPYIKNKLDLMVDATNSRGIGTAGAPGTYENIFDILMDLLDPTIVVSEVDHINEGIHNAINNMYKAMDEYVRENAPNVDADNNGIPDDVDALNDALALVASPQANSPADCRFDTCGDASGPGYFTLSANAQCSYSGHATIADGTLRFCEFAVLNKANTHETRVHHVETPSGILGKDGFVPADVGPVWTSELKYAQAAGDAVSGMDQVGGSGGVSSPAGADPVVNAPATYSIALLKTSKNRELGKAFIDYVRSPDGQSKYTDGGFIGLTDDELAGGECYSRTYDWNTGTWSTATVTARVDNSCDSD